MAQIIVGSDGMCQCSCADKCICKTGNSGMGRRCTEQDLIAAGHRPIKLYNKKDDRELEKYTLIDGKDKKIRLKCVSLPIKKKSYKGSYSKQKLWSA